MEPSIKTATSLSGMKAYMILQLYLETTMGLLMVQDQSVEPVFTIMILAHRIVMMG